MMVCHWTGIHWNGEEKGFKVFQEVVRRLHARFDHLIWMKLSELSRYWAAKELTRIKIDKGIIQFHAPFACPDFTISLPKNDSGSPVIRSGNQIKNLTKVSSRRSLQTNTWCHEGKKTIVSFDLPKGRAALEWV